jgi:hypothetical protein
MASNRIIKSRFFNSNKNTCAEIAGASIRKFRDLNKIATAARIKPVSVAILFRVLPGLME